MCWRQRRDINLCASVPCLCDRATERSMPLTTYSTAAASAAKIPGKGRGAAGGRALCRPLAAHPRPPSRLPVRRCRCIIYQEQRFPRHPNQVISVEPNPDSQPGTQLYRNFQRAYDAAMDKTMRMVFHVRAPCSGTLSALPPSQLLTSGALFCFVTGHSRAEHHRNFIHRTRLCPPRSERPSPWVRHPGLKLNIPP